ncbi:MAG: type I restriction endonuclease [Minisyncoccia bacterium]
MREQLLRFINNLKNKTFFDFNEDVTKTSIILKLLNILGWDVFNNEEVWPEYVIGSKRVDYCLRQNQQNLVFIEAKKINEDLENHQQQLLDYAFEEGIEMAILTNGIAWWFYLPLKSGSWEQRKFFSIDFLNQKEDEIINNIINFLSKESVVSKKNIEIAENMYQSNQRINVIKKSLPHAWNKLIQEPNELLIELLNDTNEKICGYRATDKQIIAEFIYNNKSQLLINLFSNQNDRIIERKNKIEKINGYLVDDYTGKQPISFVINNKKIKIRHWINMLIEICNFLYTNYQSNFEQKVYQIKGKRRSYFSKDKNQLKYPIEIKKSGIYVESNLSANMIVKLSKKLVMLFGYNGDLHIETK